MNAEAFHEAEGARDGAVRHDPHEHVRAFGHKRSKVPEIIVSGLSLRKGAIGFFLCGVDQIGEFDRVLNKEHRNIVYHDVPVALFRVEFNGEAAHITSEVG